ncbi:MAG TPA: efflux RND transporter permease subunit [Bryobacteraceae bacterium]|nr:efflux RND transporter permease subunit [Bryobacteraceae bacterium]
MWIVKVALDRPYTFLILGLLILILAPVAILRTPTDIFPNIDIPVVSVAWIFTGMNPEELEGRLTTVYEKVLTTVVDNVQHIESTTVNGIVVVKVFLQPGSSVDRANAQITAGSQTILRQLPPGTLPPLIINYNASTVPILQLSLSGPGLNEQDLNDLALNFLRAQLVTVPGAAVPYPYGGKQRQIMVNLNSALLQSKGLSPQDIVNTLSAQNVIAPSGTAKIDQFEYDVGLNSAPRTVPELNDLPIKVVGNSTIYLRDVSQVSDGFSPQTNIVRQDGRRGVLLTVVKSGAASTLSVVQGIRDLLPRVQQTLPAQLKIQLLGDQSVFVRAAVSGVVREAVIAAALTAIMILVFLGSWRSTIIIAISIPLAILTSVIVLGCLGQTINMMTLGGLALAVGILVDDATVTIENIARYLEEGQPLHDSIYQGAAQIALPAMVSTLCICIVFLPMFALQGVAHFLFQPLAQAVIFAMIASYILSRTLVPTLAMYLLKAPEQNPGRSRNPFSWALKAFDRNFERFRQSYKRLLTTAVGTRCWFVPAFLLICLSAALLIRWLGQDFFPSVDSGQFILHLRAKTGTRIEETAKLCDLVEESIRRTIPAQQVAGVLDNIGLPYSQLNYMYSTSGVIGAADADIFVTLQGKHGPTEDYIRTLRANLPREFPGVMFYFLPADITTQILNFGLPAPVDVQVEGQDLRKNHELASQVLNQLRHVPGLADLRIQQETDYPRFNVDVDRTKAAIGGYTQRDITGAMLIALSGSFQTTPTFFLNWQNGVQYNLVTQTPQYRIQSLQDLQNTPISSPTMVRPQILSYVASIDRGNEMQVLSHYNIRRIIDIYGAVQDSDLGTVGREVNRIVGENQKLLPRGSFFRVRGQMETMRTSYTALLAGLAAAIILVYLLIVVFTQSWLDPFIIVTALPAALAGIIVFLFLTHTHLSVPALMGAIMCMGVATANSILVIAFAKERLAAGSEASQAAIEAGFTRFRPVLMTALAMIIGMIPMALGLGEGGEQNAPLGRAVIGGLLLATVATLIFVPAVFSLAHGIRSACGFSSPGRGRWRRRS